MASTLAWSRPAEGIPMKMRPLSQFRVFLVAAWCATSVLTPPAGAAGPTERRLATQAFMRQKLVYSQGILEGITLEKFDLVSSNALRLRSMSVSNSWTQVGSPDYRQNLTNFQSDVDGLFKAAMDKNLNDATGAYVRVVHSCVECHRLVRLDQHLQKVAPAK
jgi:hypothetical protein